MTQRWIAVICGIALSASCASSSAASNTKPSPAPAEAEKPAEAPPKEGEQLAAQSPEERKRMLQQLFARESEPLPLRDVSGDGFTLQIEGKGSPTVEREGEDQETVTTDIGTEQPMTCVVAEHFASASMLSEVVKNVAEATNVRAARLRLVDHVDGDPIVHGEVIYSGKENPNAIGLVKIAVASGDRGGLLCTHDEPGYAKTFTRMVKSAFASLKLKDGDEGPKALWSELQLASDQGLPAGYERRDLYDNKDGYVLVTRISALLYPSVNDPIALDSRLEEYSDRKGQITGHKYVELTRGEVTAEFDVSREKNGEYAYEGTHKGKKVSGKFKAKSKSGLTSDVEVAKAVRRLLASKKKAEAKVEAYTPSRAPDATETMTLRQGETPGTIDSGEGDDAVHAVAAPDGTFSRREYAGELKVMQERVFVRGDWPTQ